MSPEALLSPVAHGRGGGGDEAAPQGEGLPAP